MGNNALLGRKAKHNVEHEPNGVEPRPMEAVEQAKALAQAKDAAKIADTIRRIDAVEEDSGFEYDAAKGELFITISRESKPEREDEDGEIIEAVPGFKFTVGPYFVGQDHDLLAMARQCGGTNPDDLKGAKPLRSKVVFMRAVKSFVNIVRSAASARMNGPKFKDGVDAAARTGGVSLEALKASIKRKCEAIKLSGSANDADRILITLEEQALSSQMEVIARLIENNPELRDALEAKLKA